LLKQAAQEKDSAMKNTLLFEIQAVVLGCALIVPSSKAADSIVNYDTAWTYVYDGGKMSDSSAANDVLRDLKVAADGSGMFVGQSAGSLLLAKLGANGKLVWKKLYTNFVQQSLGASIIQARNGDFVIGGKRYSSSLILRTDSMGNIKSSTWLWDSLNLQQLYLTRGATVNCVRETSRGTIICAAGDYFTDNNYVFKSTNDNFAAFLELDSLGNVIHWGRWIAFVGYNLGAFEIEETQAGNYLLSGNQTVVELDTAGHIVWNTAYTFSLTGVGTEVNNVTRCKIIRGNIPLVAGQAYEGNCWTNFHHLYYDGWWSPIDYADGGNTTWDTAGYQGGDDQIYDFTQLNNGNLVFVGKRYYTGSGGGLWTFVTDSTGKNLLWEKVTAVPYKSSNGSAAYPMSVCATPDSGFTIAGYLQLADSLGGYNALAAHFVPTLPASVKSLQSRIAFSSMPVSRLIGRRLVVTNAIPNTMARVSLYDVSGKRVAMQAGAGEIAIDVENMAKGTYIVQVKNAGTTLAEKILVER
jgi:Secretion system C-terminal sorting domain